MQEPLEITYHQVEPSPAIEEDIRARVAKLSRIYERVTHCRVSVEALHRQHRTGNVHEVHIVLQVPEGSLTVSRKPHKAKERYAHPDIHSAVRDAFAAAERQLKAHKARLARQVKPHPEPFMGQVAELHPAEDYGYLRDHDGRLLYFHRNSLIGGPALEELRPGEAVHFTPAEGEDGPTAVKVWRSPQPTLFRA
jgi:ribosome-associated translation inhibitor RaiA